MHFTQSAALIALLAHSIPAVISQAEGMTSSEQIYAILPTSTPRGTCGSTLEICPDCDGQSITDGWAYTYDVHCDSIITSSDDYHVSNFSAENTTQECLQACDDFDGCLGVTYLPEGQCNLATGSFVRVAQNPGYNAFVRATATSYTSIDNAIASSSSASRATTPSSTYLETSTLTSYPSAQATSVPALSAYSNTTAFPSSCQASNVTCPTCDGGRIVDSRGDTYKVYCDYQLISDDDYSPQEWLSPEGCLLECDNYDWCQGASFWPQGNCMLAKGSTTDVQPFQMPGYTAFLPVVKTSNRNPSSTTSAAWSPAFYPAVTRTSSATINRTTAKSSYSISFHPAKTVNPTATNHTNASMPAAPTCNLDAALCPTCDSHNVTDPLNCTYSISCSTTPICEETINRANSTTQIECLEYCDQDATCFAATWKEGSCDLCMRALDGQDVLFRAYTGGLLVYYSATETPSVMSSASSTFTTKTVLANATSSSISILQQQGDTMISANSHNVSMPTLQQQRSTSVTAAAPSSSLVSASLSLLHIDGDTMEAAPSTQNDVVITGTVRTLPPASTAQPIMKTITDYTLGDPRASAGGSRVSDISVTTASSGLGEGTSSSSSSIASSSVVSTLSSFVVQITGTVTTLGPAQGASTTSFVPPLSGTDISYATPGPDLTRFSGVG